MTKKQVNESIRVAKEGIEECWGDMDMQQANTSAQGEGPMTVTINMPGKNISVTTDSADEIANMLKLAGIEISGVAADGPAAAEMPAGEPEVAYVGVGAESEPSVPANQVPGDNDGDGDHDMQDHELEDDEEVAKEGNEFSGALAQAKAEGKEEFEVGGKKYKVDGSEVEEAAGDVSYTSKGGKVTQTATGLKHQAGSGVYGGTETDAEEEERKKNMDKEEVDETAQAEIAALRKYAGLGEGKKPDFLDVDKDGNKEEPMADAAKDKEEEVKEEAPATDSIYGKGVYEAQADELGRILKLAGFAESKLMNSPAGTSMDEPKEFDSLPSNKGDGSGNKHYGQNRANGQGENPMSVEESLEQKFQTAMGEYRKFVSESIARKK